MSLAILPTLAGLSFPVTKTPMMSTRVMEAASGVEYRAQNWSSPRWKFSLPIENLRQFSSFTEWSNLVGFILSQAGMFQNWLFNDTTDNTVMGQQLGIGNGIQTAFPLVRTLGPFIEPIYYCNALNAVYLNGIAQMSGFTLTQTGSYGPDTLTFATAPASSSIVTASFTFYFVCRFLEDDPEFTNFTGGRFDCKKLDFESVK